MVEGQRFTFKKDERVTGNKRIETLFASGHSFLAYPFRVVFYEYEAVALPSVSVLVSIPKKRLKKAVARNRMKRLTREAYRLNKYQLLDNYSADNQRIDIAFIYIKDELSDYVVVEKSMRKALREISNQINNR